MPVSCRQPSVETKQQTGVVTLAIIASDSKMLLMRKLADDLTVAVKRVNEDETIGCLLVLGLGNARESRQKSSARERASAVQCEDNEASQSLDRSGLTRSIAALWQCETPTIAVLGGHIGAAGLELACSCDIRIASHTAEFSFENIACADSNAEGGIWLLPRIVGVSKASELIFSGRIIDVREAQAIGLVSTAVPPEHLMLCAQKRAQSLGINTSQDLRRAKRGLRANQMPR